MKVTSHEYEGQPGMVVIELRDDIEAEYGFQVAPGMHLHYAVSDEGKRIPVSIEIEVWKGLVRFEGRSDGGSRNRKDCRDPLRDRVGRGFRGESPGSRRRRQWRSRASKGE